MSDPRPTTLRVNSTFLVRTLAVFVLLAAARAVLTSDPVSMAAWSFTTGVLVAALLLTRAPLLQLRNDRLYFWRKVRRTSVEAAEVTGVRIKSAGRSTFLVVVVGHRAPIRVPLSMSRSEDQVRLLAALQEWLPPGVPVTRAS
ncbi:hypothetical protein ACFYNO_02070 [Kitasatospora sp. NPDC006697]|uniref:hypothetical protein n=1 Tax=Kitasatospora sp. NPDC006697 TaxID=3364020 RepID=UPI0036A95AEF